MLKDIYPKMMIDASGAGQAVNWAQLLSMGSYAVLIGVPICTLIKAKYFNKHMKA